jgi:hypothetical protein
VPSIPDELEREIEESERLEAQLLEMERDLIAGDLDADARDGTHMYTPDEEGAHGRGRAGPMRTMSEDSLRSALGEQERLESELRAVEAELARAALSPTRSEAEEDRLHDALAERERLERELAALEDELRERGPSRDSSGRHDRASFPAHAAATDAAETPTAATATFSPHESENDGDAEGGAVAGAALAAAQQERRRLEEELDALAAELDDESIDGTTPLVEGQSAATDYDDATTTSRSIHAPAVHFDGHRVTGDHTLDHSVKRDSASPDSKALHRALEEVDALKEALDEADARQQELFGTFSGASCCIT